MIRRLIAAASVAFVILSSTGCRTIGMLVILDAVFDEGKHPSTRPPYKLEPYTGITGVTIVKTSPGANRKIASHDWASARVAVSLPSTVTTPYVGVCLGRDRSTIITNSCSWRLVRPGSGLVDFLPEMPYAFPGMPIATTGRVFGESAYVTAVLVDGSVNAMAPPDQEVALTNLKPRQLASHTIAMAWRWK